MSEDQKDIAPETWVEEVDEYKDHIILMRKSVLLAVKALLPEELIRYDENQDKFILIAFRRAQEAPGHSLPGVVCEIFLAFLNGLGEEMYFDGSVHKRVPLSKTRTMCINGQCEKLFVPVRMNDIIVESKEYNTVFCPACGQELVEITAVEE